MKSLITLLIGSFFLASCGLQSIPRANNNVDAAWAEVENQYKRRTDLIPNLVNTVKGYASHEKDTLEGVMEAVRGCSLSPFHMGANKQRKRYDSLDLILRNADKIEGFLQIAEENPFVEPF